jgi:hypothetical protein
MAAIENATDPKIIANGKIMADVKNKAGPKILANGEIHAATEKEADGKILASVEISVPGKIPAAMKKPALEEKPAGLENQAAVYCLGSAESPAADFLLVWLKNSRSDPRRCDVSLISPQVRIRLRLPCFYGRTLSRTVPAVCTGLPCQELAKIHAATKIQAAT